LEGCWCFALSDIFRVMFLCFLLFFWLESRPTLPHRQITSLLIISILVFAELSGVESFKFLLWSENTKSLGLSGIKRLKCIFRVSQPWTVTTIGVGGGGVQEVQAHPQKFWFVENPGKSLKIRAKSAEIWAKSVKTFAKYLKIWTNSLKIWTEMVPDVCRINMKTFFWRSSRKQSSWEIIPTTSGPKLFRASLGKFGQKFFAPPKICPCSPTCSRRTENKTSCLWPHKWSTVDVVAVYLSRE